MECPPAVSLVIPMRNESQRVWSSTMALREVLKSLGNSFEILLIENGSSDDTPIIAGAMASRFRDVKLLRLPEASIGEAIRLGLRRASGDKVVCYPIDLSVELGFIPACLSLLDEADVVLASKRVGRDGRPLVRRVASKGYHWLVRLLCGTSLSDTTCAKGYRRVIVRDLIGAAPGYSRVFETEMVLEAERLGLRVVELPVSVVERRSSREGLWRKVGSKLEDLVSFRIDSLSLFGGVPLIVGGVLWLVALAAEKLRDQATGFQSPYSFLTAILLILGGFQIVALGLVSRLILQVRHEVSGVWPELGEAREPPVRYSHREDE